MIDKRERKKRKLWQGIFLSAVGAAVIVFAVIGLMFWARPTRSYVEKRDLASLPKLTMEGLWNGDYFDKVSTWYSETYPARDALLTAHSNLEQAYGIRTMTIVNQANAKGDDIPDANTGVAPAPLIVDDKTSAAKTSAETSSATSQKTEPSGTSQATSSASSAAPEEPAQTEDHAITVTPETAGEILIADGTGFEMFYFNQAGSDAYASMINTVRSKLPASTTLYDIIVPNSSGICLSEDVQKQVGVSDQKKAIEYTYSRIDPSVKTVPTFESLKNHNGEYIYFRTDHHWTQLGAYYTYRDFCKAKGITPHNKTDYQTAAYPDFLGSFYSSSGQSPALAANPDTVEVFIPIATNTFTFTTKDGTQTKWDIVHDVSDYKSGQKYSAFIAGDQPFSVIDNPNISDGTSCVLIKESYGNAFAPFLTDHYDKVYIVDYRYYKDDLTAFVKDNNVTDVIFLNNDQFLLVKRSADMNALFK